MEKKYHEILDYASVLIYIFAYAIIAFAIVANTFKGLTP
jgi:hypothetical protein